MTNILSIVPDVALQMPEFSSVKDSSNILGVACRTVSKSITYFYVKLTSQKIYLYEMNQTAADAHFQFIRSDLDSAGSYFNKNIKLQYPYMDITDIVVIKVNDWTVILGSESNIGIRCGASIETTIDII